MNALVKIGLGMMAMGLLITFVLPVVAFVVLVLVAAVADAAPTEDAVPGLQEPAAIERVVTIKQTQQTMPAALDFVSRVGVAGSWEPASWSSRAPSSRWARLITWSVT